MGVNPQTHETIMEMKDAMTDGGEPIETKTRSVQFQRDSPYLNLTAMGRDVLDISDDMEMSIEIYRSGIWIEPQQ